MVLIPFEGAAEALFTRGRLNLVKLGFHAVVEGPHRVLHIVAGCASRFSEMQNVADPLVESSFHGILLCFSEGSGARSPIRGSRGIEVGEDFHIQTSDISKELVVPVFCDQDLKDAGANGGHPSNRCGVDPTVGKELEQSSDSLLLLDMEIQRSAGDLSCPLAGKSSLLHTVCI